MVSDRTSLECSFISFGSVIVLLQLTCNWLYYIFFGLWLGADHIPSKVKVDFFAVWWAQFTKKIWVVNPPNRHTGPETLLSHKGVPDKFGVPQKLENTVALCTTVALLSLVARSLDPYAEDCQFETDFSHHVPRKYLWVPFSSSYTKSECSHTYCSHNARAYEI